MTDWSVLIFQPQEEAVKAAELAVIERLMPEFERRSVQVVTLPSDGESQAPLYVIGPDKRVELAMRYPAGLGRNFEEVLRVIDALQLRRRSAVAQDC